MKPKLKKVFKIFFIGLTVLCLVSLGLLTWAWWTLQQRDTQEALAAQITEQLPEPFKRSSSMTAIGGRLPGYFFIEGIEGSLPNGDTYKLGQIQLHWDWMELLDRKLVIREIKVQSLAVHLIHGQDGTWLPDLATDSTTPPPQQEEEQTTEPELVFPLFTFALESFELSSIDFKASSNIETWENLHFDLEQLKLDVLLHTSEQGLDGALSCFGNFKLKVKSYPELTSSFSLSFLPQNDQIDFKLDSIALNTEHSSLGLNAHLQITPWDWQDIRVEDIVKNLRLDLEVSPSHLGQNDLHIFAPDLPLPDDLHLSAKVSFEKEVLSVRSDISLDQNNLQLFVQMDEWNPNTPLEGSANLNLTTDVMLADWHPELKGDVSQTLTFTGELAQFDSWIAHHGMVAKASYQSVQLPQLELKTKLTDRITNHRLQVHPDLGAEPLLALSSTLNLQRCETIFEFSPDALEQDTHLDLKTHDIAGLLEPYSKWISLPEKPKGGVHMKLSSAGNLHALDYELELNADHIEFGQPLFKALKTQMTGNLNPHELLSANVQLGLERSNNQPLVWHEGLGALSANVHHVLSLIQLPDLKLQIHEPEAVQPLSQLSVAVHAPSSNVIDFSFDAWEQDEQKIDVDAQIRSAIDQLSLHLKTLTLDASPWLTQGANLISEAITLQQPFEIRLDTHHQHLTVSPFQLGQHQWLEASGHLNQDGWMDFDFDLSPPAFQDILKELQVELPFETRGRALLKAQLKGHFLKPMALLDFKTEALSFSKEDLPDLHLDTLRFSVSANTLSSNGILIHGEMKPRDEAGFVFDLHSPWAIPENETLEALPQLGDRLFFELGTPEHEAMGLGAFAPFYPEIIKELSGGWKLHLTGEVPLADPLQTDFKGHFALVDLRCELADLPPPFEQGSLKINLSPSLVSLETFEFTQPEKGLISVMGSASSANLASWSNPQWDLTVNIKEWLTQKPPLLKVWNKGDLKLSGNLHAHDIKGDLAIYDLLLKPGEADLPKAALEGRDPNLKVVEQLESWEEIDRQEEAQPQEAPNALKNANIDVAVRFLKNNWIRHNLFTGELSGKVTALKSWGQDGVHPKGTVNLKHSSLKLQGQRFKMDEGNLIWQGDVIPAIDMTYQVEVEPYTIDLMLRNDRADLVQPEFSSRPWLDNSDIISVLLMGRPLHAEAQAESGDGNFAQDMAVSQGVSHLAKEMGLGDMGVEVDDVSSTGGTVRVGRYLHPKVFVSAAQTMGDEESNELSVEYEFKKNYKLKLSQESALPPGVDLEWGKDY